MKIMNATGVQISLIGRDERLIRTYHPDEVEIELMLSVDHDSPPTERWIVNVVGADGRLYDIKIEGIKVRSYHVPKAMDDVMYIVHEEVALAFPYRDDLMFVPLMLGDKRVTVYHFSSYFKMRLHPPTKTHSPIGIVGIKG